MPMAVIQLFTSTSITPNTPSTTDGKRLCSCRPCQRLNNRGSKAKVDIPCNTRIERSLCRCGVIAAHKLAGINSEQNTR